MMIRIASGLAAGLVLLGILLAGDLVILGAVAVIAIVAVLEFCRALKHMGHTPFVPVCTVCAALLFPLGLIYRHLSKDLQPVMLLLLGFCIFIVLAVLLLMNYRSDPGQAAIRMRSPGDLAATLLCIAYIPGLLFFIILLLALPAGRFLLWMLLAGTIGEDTFAYFTGVIFGKHRILPEISPKKTWEGSIGGVLGSMALVALAGMGFAGGEVSLSGMPWSVWLGLGFLTGTMGQLGDWTASLLKRHAGIKDFGRLLPGHGGILDRCDSFLFNIPTVYFYAVLVMGPLSGSR
ncbi:MAG TPA: hypothetical protein DD727_09180 [Clostridiales bacterium]|nr:hypothetical protein [Clostridiales bacterium]